MASKWTEQALRERGLELQRQLPGVEHQILKWPERTMHATKKRTLLSKLEDITRRIAHRQSCVHHENGVLLLTRHHRGRFTERCPFCGEQHTFDWVDGAHQLPCDGSKHFVCDWTLASDGAKLLQTDGCVVRTQLKAREAADMYNNVERYDLYTLLKLEASAAKETGLFWGSKLREVREAVAELAAKELRIHSGLLVLYRQTANSPTERCPFCDLKHMHREPDGLKQAPCDNKYRFVADEIRLKDRVVRRADGYLLLTKDTNRLRTPRRKRIDV